MFWNLKTLNIFGWYKGSVLDLKLIKALPSCWVSSFKSVVGLFAFSNLTLMKQLPSHRAVKFVIP